MLTVRFIRHGESLANAGGITSETHSIPLTDRGWAQALEVSESFTAAPALLVASPYLRAHDTAKPTVARFPLVPFEIWPVQEFTYLAAERCLDTTTAHRLPWATAFWTAADPHYVDGGGAESTGISSAACERCSTALRGSPCQLPRSSRTACS